MNGNLDAEFEILKLHVDAGNEFYIHENFRTEAFNYFNSQNQTEWEAFDSFFNRFHIFWSEELDGFPFRVLKKYSEVKNVFEELLKLANEWEQEHLGSYVHKGTPYYFYGVAAIKHGDLDKGLLLMHQAAEEDKRYNRDISPALSFIILDVSNVEQFFRSKVLIVGSFLEELLTEYRNTHGVTHSVTLDLETLRKKFLVKKKFYDASYLFVYSIFRYFRYKNEIQEKYRQNPLASYIETSLILDLCKLCEILIKDRYPNPTSGYESMPPKYHRFCSNISTVRIRQQHFDAVYGEMKEHFTNTVNKLLRNDFRFRGVAGPYLDIESDLTLTYAIRNFSAHTISEKRVIYQKFPQIVERILDTFFFIVEKKFR